MQEGHRGGDFEECRTRCAFCRCFFVELFDSRLNLGRQFLKRIGLTWLAIDNNSFFDAVQMWGGVKSRAVPGLFEHSRDHGRSRTFSLSSRYVNGFEILLRV